MSHDQAEKCASCAHGEECASSDEHLCKLDPELDTGCAEGCSHPEHRPLQMDEARAAVGRLVCGALAGAIEAGSRDVLLAKDKVRAENGQKFVAAARELLISIDRQVKNFERPAILRPRRGVHLVR